MLEPENLDQWVRENSALPPLVMHALGNIVFKWNVCEYWTNAIFCDVLGVSENDARALTYDMSSASIWDKIKYFAKKRGINEEVLGHLDHASLMFDRCRINRNRYVHAIGITTGERRGLQMAKADKKSTGSQPIPDDLETIRSVSDSIKSLIQYLSSVDLVVADPERAALPQKPLLPELIEKLPLQSHQEL
ncbi:hypothetical protein FPY71_10210 [Aureimonas fodinaquatilis]|uniref:Uncharacterized protein n=1 Tax=Aureimonas fodinaquatilis TaxID=2565783 RepID=A0A5B0DZ68_9HYPH|nr:hypothetical protein [Aureimonas fodinaquatilis]KAA0970840.1 hypothetical protein FPY71_10210 [Aureimonas fodinaquatilis]